MPPRLTYPGVYVEEQASGVRTITGVATSTALFIGMARRGPIGRPTPVRSVDQFDQTFGGDPTYGEMAVQVRQFFLNGGAEAIIVRPEADGLDPATVTLLRETGTDPALNLEARDAGKIGAEIRAVVDYDTATPEMTFNMALFRRSIDTNGAVVISENEFFDNLSMDPADPRHVVTVLNAQSALVKATLPTLGATNQGGFSASGLILPPPGADRLNLLNDILSRGNRMKVAVDGGASVTAALTVPVTDDAAFPGDAADAINAALLAGGQSGTVQGDYLAFGAEADGGGDVLRFQSASGEQKSVVITPAPQQDCTRELHLGSAAGGIEVGTFARFRPAPSGYVTRINTLASGTFGSNSDLSRLVSLATTIPADITQLVFDDQTPGPAYSAPVAIDGALANLLKGSASSLGVGSLRNLTLHLDTIAESLATAVGTNWTVRRYGYRIAVSPNYGDSNTGTLAALTSSGGGSFNIGGANEIGRAAIANNTAAYSLGSSGNPRRQTPGDAGSDGNVPVLADYQAVFSTVESEVDLFNLMVLPRGDGQSDAMRSELWGPASAFCQRERAFLLVDPPADEQSGWKTVDDAKTGIKDLRLGTVTDHAAIYWPRLKVASRSAPVDPAGTVAGIMARTDTRRGVWKAPAGLEATTLGATGFEHLVSDSENGVTNPEAINTLRQFAAGGVIWGARTMAGFDNSGENDYRYVPVRRIALFIEESLFRGLKFAVFEPNDEPLWAQIRLAAGAFMNNLFRQGAFQGQKASDAYLVRCDATTTTQNDINLGRVNVLVGFAPLRPAEFVVLTVRQLAGQVQT